MLKIFLDKIDKIIFFGKLKKFYKIFFYKKISINHKKNDFSYNYFTQYNKNYNSEINVLCEKYGSDKGESSEQIKPYNWFAHNYADVYELIFKLKKEDVKLLIECGIGTNNPDIPSSMGIKGKPGASLRMWRDFFHNANIIGVDIDKNILFSEVRIQTYQCDQTNKLSISEFISNANVKKNSADIIIDDGLHEFEAGKIFFENTIECLARNGFYIIEDVSLKDMILYKDYFSVLKKKYNVHFFNLNTPKRSKDDDNRLIIVSRNY